MDGAMTALTLPFAVTALVGLAGLASVLLISRGGEAEKVRANRRSRRS